MLKAFPLEFQPTACHTRQVSCMTLFMAKLEENREVRQLQRTPMKMTVGSESWSLALERLDKW